MYIDFGVSMSVVSTEQQPFNNIVHDSDLVIKIREKVHAAARRLKFSNDKCMNAANSDILIN